MSSVGSSYGAGFIGSGWFVAANEEEKEGSSEEENDGNIQEGM